MTSMLSFQENYLRKIYRTHVVFRKQISCFLLRGGEGHGGTKKQQGIVPGILPENLPGILPGNLPGILPYVFAGFCHQYFAAYFVKVRAIFAG